MRWRGGWELKKLTLPSTGDRPPDLAQRQRRASAGRSPPAHPISEDARPRGPVTAFRGRTAGRGSADGGGWIGGGGINHYSLLRLCLEGVLTLWA